MTRPQPSRIEVIGDPYDTPDPRGTSAVNHIELRVDSAGYVVSAQIVDPPADGQAYQKQRKATQEPSTEQG